MGNVLELALSGAGGALISSVAGVIGMRIHDAREQRSRERSETLARETVEQTELRQENNQIYSQILAQMTALRQENNEWRDKDLERHRQLLSLETRCEEGVRQVVTERNLRQQAERDRDAALVRCASLEGQMHRRIQTWPQGESV